MPTADFLNVFFLITWYHLVSQGVFYDIQQPCRDIKTSKFDLPQKALILPLEEAWIVAF